LTIEFGSLDLDLPTLSMKLAQITGPSKFQHKEEEEEEEEEELRVG
jgi:hypothetical protein